MVTVDFFTRCFFHCVTAGSGPSQAEHELGIKQNVTFLALLNPSSENDCRRQFNIPPKQWMRAAILYGSERPSQRPSSRRQPHWEPPGSLAKCYPSLHKRAQPGRTDRNTEIPLCTAHTKSGEQRGAGLNPSSRLCKAPSWMMLIET